MHVLLTRPETDAEPLKSRIEQLGHRVSLAPLLTIVLEPVPEKAISHAPAIVATSRNGLRALAASPALKAALELPVFVVGAGTAAYAKDLGFLDIVSGPGTAADLVPIIAAHHAAKTGPMVHLAGDHLAFDLAAALADLGIRLIALPAYRSVAAETFDPGIAAGLEAKGFDAVILMSPRTAAIWADLMQKPSFAAALTAMTHICLSEAVAAEVRDKLPKKCPAPLPAARIEVAAKPNAEEILALVSRLAAQSIPG
jgi:uroporphyrinogen-III synthase